jgi:glycolate oxidase iron-sulfur subunit
MADANVAAFDMKGIDAIVVNHGGCGAMLREYGLHWHDGEQPRRQAFAEMVQDVHEFIDELGPVAPEGRIEAVATYHDSCHLAHAQKVVQPPRRLLSMIPGLELRDLPETDICCGSAGTYNLNHPAMADRLLDRKVDNILRTGAQIVLAANAGCLLQIDSALRQRRQKLALLHPMELLDLSYREKPLSSLNGQR